MDWPKLKKKIKINKIVYSAYNNRFNLIIISKYI